MVLKFVSTHVRFCTHFEVVKLTDNNIVQILKMHNNHVMAFFHVGAFRLSCDQKGWQNGPLCHDRKRIMKINVVRRRYWALHFFPTRKEKISPSKMGAGEIPRDPVMLYMCCRLASKSSAVRRLLLPQTEIVPKTQPP